MHATELSSRDLPPAHVANGSVPTFLALSRDPFVKCALALLEDFCGTSFRVERTDTTAPVVDVLYGNRQAQPCRLRIPCLPAYVAANIPGMPTPGDFHTAMHPDAAFPFDLVEALRFWLCDCGNDLVTKEGFDAHGRLKALHSVQEVLELRRVPIVNSYLILIRHWLEVRCRIVAHRLLPPGAKCAIVLSHDVDNPIDPSDCSHKLWMAGKAARGEQWNHAIGCVKEAVHCAARRIVGNHERFALFDEIEAAEDRLGLRSTFFFAPTSQIEGSRFDVTYDVSAPRFRKIFEKMKPGGWDIGLHISYDAHRSAERIALEKQRLEQLIDQPVEGSRHHYWHLGHPAYTALAHHESAQLTYDSSVAFNDAPGYRLGIAYPFHPWNPSTSQTISTLQIPTVVMDGHYFYSPRSAENAVVDFESLIEDLKRFEGIAAIDWHSHTSFPGSVAYAEWGKAYLRLIQVLAADRSVAVLSFAQLLALIRARASSPA